MAAITQDREMREHFVEGGFDEPQALALADGFCALRNWIRGDTQELFKGEVRVIRWWIASVSVVLIIMTVAVTIFFGVVVASLTDNNPVEIKNYYAVPTPVATAPTTPPAD